MTNVFVLQYDGRLQGLFDSEAAAHQRIVTDALRGKLIVDATLTEQPIIGAEPSRNPLDYADVVEAIKEQKKIQAIKHLRNHVAGLSLREAKEAVEAVYDSIPKNPVPAPEPVRERYILDHNTWDWDLLLDDSGDKWVRIGHEQYVLVGDDFVSGDPLPFKDEGCPVLSEEQIRETLGITDYWDL